MPLLFSLGQHKVLQATQEQLRPQERLMASWTTCTWCHSQRELVVCVLSKRHFFFAHVGVRPASCDVLEQIVRNEDPRAVVWRGSGMDFREQGIKILGIPGIMTSSQPFMERKSAEHATLLERIPAVPDVQSAWLLLLHCAQARANFLLRGVQPSLSAPFCCKTRQQFVALSV